MSILTKIAVVLLVVVALFSAPIFINQAVTGPNWRDLANIQKERATLAETQSQNHMLAALVWQRYLEEEKRKSEDLAQRLREAIDAKSVDVQRLTREKNELLGRVNELTASLDALQATLASAQNQNKQITAELEAQRKIGIDTADLLRAAMDKIKELMATVENQTKTVAALHEQLSQKEGEVKELTEKVTRLDQELTRWKAGKGPAAEAVRTLAPQPGTKIEGTITAVRDDLASLNVGSASGVKRGMEFVIYRNNNFVAHLRIAEVYPSSCAGVVFDVQREVQQGDKATTSLE